MGKKVYIGMALTEAPDWFREGFQNRLKDGLRAEGIEILDFLGLVVGDESNVYRHDREGAERADLAIFIVDYPSTGMGMEIVLRFVSNKPMLLFAQREKRVTRMLTGFASVEDVEFTRYVDTDDIVASVLDFFSD